MSHDHDMAYLHQGYGERMHMERSMYTIMTPTHDREHVHKHEHTHDHEHVHDRNIHTAMTRNTQESISTVMSTAACRRFLPLSAAVILTPRRARAGRFFQILAKQKQSARCAARSGAFSRGKAVDSIVDIVAAAVCLDNLAPDEVPIVTGLCGKRLHPMPAWTDSVPVPAVLKYRADTFVPAFIPTGTKGELVTPTGATIVAAIRTRLRIPSNAQKQVLEPENGRMSGRHFEL